MKFRKELMLNNVSKLRVVGTVVFRVQCTYVQAEKLSHTILLRRRHNCEKVKLSK
jgi:hypothetical protein